MTSSGTDGSHLPLEARIQSSQLSGEPLVPSVVEEHGRPERVPLGLASSRNSLFSVFRRARPSSADSVRSTKSNDSFLNAFDDFSVNVSSTNLESPKMARASSHKLRGVLKATEAYRNAMQALGIASADLGAALYDYADTKGCRSGQTALPEHHVDIDVDAAAGLHMLISSHLHVLSQSFKDNVETLLTTASEEYKDELAAREREFQRVLTAKMSALHTSESRRIKESRSRSRNLDRYRSSLLDLTSQVDDINRAKFDFLSDLHSLETNVAENVHKCLSTAVTAEIEVFDAIARKGWSGAGLDGLLAGCPDPFDDPRPSPKREASGTNLFSMIPAQIIPSDRKESVDNTDLDDLSHEKGPSRHEDAELSKTPDETGHANDKNIEETRTGFRSPVKYSAIGSSAETGATSTPARPTSSQNSQINSQINSPINSPINSRSNSADHSPTRSSNRVSEPISSPLQSPSPHEVQELPTEPLDPSRSANSIYNTKPGADANTSVDSMALDVHL